MASLLKQSTAATVKLGPFVDDADGKTAETGLTIQKADVRLSKNGGNMAAASADQGTSDAGAPHDELGYYDVSLDATDTGTLGRLKVMVSTSGALPVWAEFMVVPANVYDSLVAGSDKLQVDAAELSGDSTAADNAEAFFDGTGYAGTNNVIPTVTTVSDAVTVGTNNDKTGYSLSAAAIQAIWDALTSALSTAGSIGKLLVDNINATISSRSSHTAAEVADAVWEETLADHEGTSGSTAEALADAGGSGASAADIADAVLDEALSGHTTAGTLGKAVSDILADTNELQTDWADGGRLDLILDARASQASLTSLVTTVGVAGAGLTAIPWNVSWDAEVQSEVADALDAAIPATPTANSINERIKTLDEAYTATRAGYLDNINNANLANVPAFPSNFAALGINASGDVSRVTLVDTVTTLTGHTAQTGDSYAIVSSGTHGNAALKTLIDAVHTVVDAILADTGSDGVALSAAVCNKIADHVRRRTQANVEASSDGDPLGLSSLYGLIQQAQEASISNGTLTVNKTDGATVLGTKTLTTDGTADPITGVA